MFVCHQNVEYHINKGVLGQTKETQHKVWEARGREVQPHTTECFHDFYKNLQVPVMPATLADVCKVIEIYYILRVRTPFARNTGTAYERRQGLTLNHQRNVCMCVCTLQQCYYSMEAVTFKYRSINDKLLFRVFICFRGKRSRVLILQLARRSE